MAIFRDKRKQVVTSLDLESEVRDGRKCLVQKEVEKEVSKSDANAEKIWSDFQTSLSEDNKLTIRQALKIGIANTIKKGNDNFYAMYNEDKIVEAESVTVSDEPKEETKIIKADNVDITKEPKKEEKLVKEDKKKAKKEKSKKKKTQKKETSNKKEPEYEYIYLESDKIIDVEFKEDNGDSLSENRKQLKEERKKEREKQAQTREELNTLISSWNSIMWQAKVCTTRFDTYRMDSIQRTDYGWSFKVYAPKGIPLQKLDILTPNIESGLGCKFMFNINQSNRFASCFILYEGAVDYNAIPFKPIRVKPYEVFAGLSINGEPLIMNMILSPHIMIAGGTRRGKNGAADSILLSWINSCTEDEINLFLFQCAKIDLLKYKKCKQVKACCLEDFEEMFNIMQHVIEVEIPRRLKLFTEMFAERTGENILDYNNLYPENQLPYIVLVFDEFATLMFQNKGDDEVNGYKNGILTYLSKIGSMGAAVGVFYMIMHQKPEKALCPTFIKNMTSIRICFGFDDDSPGRIVLGERDGEKVKGLPPRRAYVNNDGKLSLMYTMNLTGRRDAYIRPHEVNDKKDFMSEQREFKFDKLEIPNSTGIENIENKEAVQLEGGKLKLKEKTKSKKINEDKLLKKLELEKEDNEEEHEDGINYNDVLDVEPIENYEEETEQEIKEVKPEIKEVKPIVEEIEQEVKEVKPIVEEIKPIVEEIKQEIKEVKPEVKNDNTINIEKELEIKRLKEEIEALKKSLNNTKNEIEEIKEVSLSVVQNNNTKAKQNKVKGDKNESNSTSKETKDTKIKVDDKKQNMGVVSISGKLKAIDIDNIDVEIEKIVAQNMKNNPNWVPYEPKEGDKEVVMGKLGITKSNKIKVGGR